jgi:hypothetical protein
LTTWLASRWPRLGWLAGPSVDYALGLALLAISLADVWLAGYLVCRAVWGP